MRVRCSHTLPLVLLNMFLLNSVNGGTDNSNGDLKSSSLKTYPNAEWKWKRSGIIPMDISFGEAVILAREEAKCLRDFGQKMDTHRKYSAFTCSPTSSNYTLCNQCTNLTKLKRNQQDCEDYCTNDMDGTCMNRCIRINEAVESESKEIESQYLNTENSSAEKFLNNSHTQLNNNELSNSHNESNSEAPNSFSSQIISSIVDHVIGNLIQSPQVFCEGVTYMETDINSLPDTNNSHDKSGNKIASLGQNHFILLTWSVVGQVDTEGSALNSTSNPMLRNSYKESQEIIYNETKHGVNDFKNINTERNNTPLVFVIQSYSHNQAEWKTVAKTIYELQTVDVAYLSDMYQWRITAVGPEGIVDDVYTENYTTLDGYVTPGPPKKIYVVETTVHENSTDVLIGWDPPNENACFYKVVLQSYDGEERPKQIRIKEDPLGVHRYWFENLRFGTQYSVRITTRDPKWNSYESALTELIFKTPTCLQSHNYRFDKCDPPPPRDITATTVQTKVTGSDTRVFLVTLKWQPPSNTSVSNPIEKYVVEVKAMSLRPQNHRSFQSLSINSSVTKSKDSTMNADNFSHNTTLFKPIVVPGNTTQVAIDNLRLNTDYTVMITAISSKGASSPARFHISTKYTLDEFTNSSLHNWLYLAIPVTMMMFVLLTCHFARLYFQKRQVKMARNHYFQSMEERDAMSADWSIVPLTDETAQWKLFDDNFPKDKWEIVYENLTLGEVIGQGAFGVVHRATIQSKKLQASLKYRQCVENPAFKAKGSEKENDKDVETVAVKMLKVSATRDDREQLIKEIVTMQNLGCHPQIVGLLGACTKGRALCLVLEYCPGGDLLTFLRKVRAKYWPTLGLTDNKNTSLTEISSSPNTNDNDSNKKSSSCSPINYADIGSFSNYSSSPPIKGPEGMHEYGNTNEAGEIKQRQPTPPERTFSMENVSMVSEAEECRPIDERDVLSYARQIAMGMEYLEKNRVVHRDLACRNVLLLGDYKQLKISDFGLSRDVYTWNVYHQKSNGKLPIKWMAIESIFTHFFTTKSDVWSFGILLWELVTLGGTPYPGLGNTELFHLLKSGYRMERPDNCSEELYALMKKCWRTASAARPNFTELRQHLETMMESAEPSLYLSLMGDIPSDYFHLSSRNDLMDHREFDHRLSPTKESQSSKAGHYRRRQHSYPYQGISFGEGNHDRPHGSNRIVRHSSENSSADRKISKDTNESFNPKLTGGSVNLRSDQRKKRLSLDYNTNAPKSYTSPDSGIQRSEVGLNDFCDQVSCTDDDAIEVDVCEDGVDPEEVKLAKNNCFPMKNMNINNITIIENQSYDLTDENLFI